MYPFQKSMEISPYGVVLVTVAKELKNKSDATEIAEAVCNNLAHLLLEKGYVITQVNNPDSPICLNFEESKE